MLCRREKCAAALLVSFLGFFLAPRRVDEFDVRQTSLTKLDACTKAPKEGDDQRACDNTFSENFSSSKTMSVPSKIQKRERARREEEEREQVVRDVAQEPRSLAIEQRIDVQPYRLLPSSMMDRRAQRCAVIWKCCAVLSKTILPMPCHAMPHLSNVRRHRKPRQPCNAKVPETKTKEACLKRCADGQRNHVRQNGCFS
ncbi:unnamed protein product [Musa hybrid cultivar]